ncbi:hypothetical protein [Chitinophaga rupis]|nr:hypothetical protein [Chitinophaga rupis]
MSQRRKLLFPVVFYPVIVTGLALLLITWDKKIHPLIYPVSAKSEITLTLHNGQVIPIRASPAGNVAYVYINVDSILYAAKRATGMKIRV